MNKDEICLCIFLVIGAIVVFFIYRQKVSSEDLAAFFRLMDAIPDVVDTFKIKV